MKYKIKTEQHGPPKEQRYIPILILKKQNVDDNHIGQVYIYTRGNFFLKID